MKKIVMLAAMAMLVFGAAFAKAECTVEDAQKKAMDVTTQLQALAQKDAARFQKLMQEFQQKAQEMQQMKDIDEVCKYYDEMLEKAK